jgi:hypothetical protein
VRSLPAPQQWDLRPRSLAELFIYAVSQIAITLLYFDLRIRREGLDIAVVRREEEVATNP